MTMAAKIECGVWFFSSTGHSPLGDGASAVVYHIAGINFRGFELRRLFAVKVSRMLQSVNFDVRLARVQLVCATPDTFTAALLEAAAFLFNCTRCLVLTTYPLL